MVMPDSSRKPEAAPPKRVWTANEMGRAGGLKGGPARAKALSKRQLRASARKAARARWDKVRKAKKAEEVKNVEM